MDINKYMLENDLSIGNNIAEDHGRWHFHDLNVRLDEKYFDESEVTQLKAGSYNCIEKINGYISYLKKQKELQ